MSSAFRMPAFGRRRPGRSGDPRDRRRRALAVAGVVVALLIVYAVFTNIWTSKLWYASAGLGSVFSTLLVTRVVMFLVVGVVMAVIITGNVWIAFSARFHPDSAGAGPSPGAQRWAQNVAARPRVAAAVLSDEVIVFGGIAGAGMWRTFLAWSHRTSFGVKDPQFGKDISFYVFDYPWLRALLGIGYSVVLLSLVAAVATHYLYGGFRPAAKGRRAIGPAQVQFSVLLGVLVLLKGFGYWLDRYGQALNQNRNFTGIAYTGDHAVIPSKSILVAICVLAALLFFANVIRRTWLLPVTGVIAVVVSSILIGVIWPGALQQLKVRPSEADREAPYITRNIDATRAAYGIDKVQVTNYNAATTLSPSQLSKDAAVIPGIRLLDPTIVSQTYDQLQQVRGFYSFPDVLDVDRYTFKGSTQPQDTVLAVREVNTTGLPTGQQNWTNEHTVYTHGYGVVAANGNQSTSAGNPVFSEYDLPPQGKLGTYEGRIYYGQQSPTYSIVGAPAGSTQVELDYPEGSSTGNAVAQYYTYRGIGGVPIGSFGRQLLYATKFHDPNIVLSGRVNDDSRIMYDRNPRVRVEKAAPWLTVDGDPYPAVVDGRVKWVLDGYTTTPNYPNSERVSLEDSTSDSLTTRTAVAQQPGQTINYIRNSVKATVDAYDGTVSLYAWDDTDPILKTWMKVFPGLVAPKSAIPASLKAHLRYPEDMFKVQRDLLARYHVTDAKTWYSGNDQWKVPTDPTDTTNTQLQPPYYLSLKMPGQNSASFSLTSSFVPQSTGQPGASGSSVRANLSAYMAVDADASSSDYGTFRILRLPTNSPIFGPGQAENAFQNDDSIRQALQAFKIAGSSVQVLMGNLLTLPLGGGLLYVQPVYSQTSSTQAGSYPLLRYVLVSFANQVDYGTTLSQALGKLFNTSTQTDQSDQGNDNSTATVGNATVVQQELTAAQTSFTAAQADLKKGDLQGYAKNVAAAQQHVAKAEAAAKQLPSKSSTPTPTPTPTSSPSSPTPTSTTSPTPG